MNAIQLLSSQPWVERLGWTLLHFLWQGILISGIYAGVRRWTARSSSPNTRYILACTALAAMIAGPLVTWILLGPSDPAPVAVSITVPGASAASATSIASVRATVSGVQPAQFLPWVVAIWLAGAIGFWVRLIGGWIVAMRLGSRLVRPAPWEWQQTLDRLKTRIRVSRPVQLLISSLVQVPTVVGWLRPVVLVPVGALTGLPTGEIEALLIHELAHIRRHDYLVNILQSVAEALLFYHPAVWWVSGHIRAERELCCDDIAVSACGDVLTYARALAELESCRPAHLHAAVAANGGSLADRIGRLLGQPRRASRTFPGPGVMVSAILLVALACVVFAQSEARPEFAVASIKSSQEQRFMAVVPHPGGSLTANAPLRLLIQNAYTVQPFQILGGPAWIDSDRYNIEARPEANTSRSQMFLMLRTLLEDRFKLKVHRETKELPVYVLASAKGAVKLQAPKEGSCIAFDAGAETPRPIAPGQPGPCGSVMVMMSPAGMGMRGGKVPMAELTRILSMMLGRSVIDKTGFAGTFDVDVQFAPDQSLAGMPIPNAAAETTGPSIFNALQEQLGLKLESAKGPVDVLVIDRAEKPSVN